MPLHDFSCPDCGAEFEEVIPVGMHNTPCPECGKTAEKVFTKSAATLRLYIPDYPGCHKHRAGYVHSHGDRPGTKIQSTGWGPGHKQ